MKILKDWYFEWLDKRSATVFRQEILSEAHTAIRLAKQESDLNEIIKHWAEEKMKESLYYNDFVNACANNSYLVDALVDSIKRKQLK